jgi:hypothetical protein
MLCFSKVLYKIRFETKMEGLVIRRRFVPLLALLFIISTVTALGPVEIGRGKSNVIVNLDAGQKSSGNTMHFGTQGFAAPAIPQFAELSPGTMVHQAKLYRDESRKLYADARTILNRTSVAGDFAEQSSEKSAASEENSRMSANSSLSNSLLCKAYLDQAKSMFNKTLAMVNRTESLARNVTEMENATRDSAEKAAHSAQLADAYLNYSVSQRDNISVLMKRIETLEASFAELEGKGTQKR